MTSIPLQGSLAETPVPKLLLELYREHYSGGLSLNWQRIQKKILFYEGAPVAAESDLASETLRVQLSSQGTLSDEDVARVEQTMESKGYDESSALLALGLLQPRELFIALKELVRRRTISCFGWSEGSYELCPEEAAADNIQSFRADPLALVQEGLETVWSVDRMLQALAPRMDGFPVATPPLSGAIERLHTDEATEAMFLQLDGSSSLGEVLGGVVRSPRALAAAWVIDASGLLRYRKTAIKQSDDGKEPEIEIEIAGVLDAPPPNVCGTPAVASSPEPEAGVAADADKAEAMEREVLKRLEHLPELDFYALLEVERDAGAGAIKKAYFKAAKRYHPDALARLALGSLKQEAAVVFSRIAEAYEVLSNDQKRAEYNAAQDSDAPQIDTTSLAQAETFFRKGEILVRMGDFRGALQYLENAVELWPDEAAYHSLLGWALYKKNPSEPERAKEHLAAAMALAPKDPEVHFRMGIVLGALGETAGAREALATARQLGPAAKETS